MKPIRKRWLGLSLASTLIAIGAFSTPAMAADYSGNCAFIPNHVTGNATINDSACVIDTGATLIVDGTLTIDADSVDVKSEIQSVGKVTIRTNGGGELKLRKKASSENSDILLQSPQNRIDTKALEAGNSVQVDAGLNGAEGATWDVKVDGPIVVNKLQTFPQNPNIHANVLLRAAGAISTKTIRTDGGLGASSVKSGGIQIEAYRNGAGAANASEFVIGGTGYPNGVNGDLITHSTIGGGTSSTFIIGGININNGARFNTGNIRVEDMTAIKVRATQSRSGTIILNANAGKIVFATGKLNTDGADGQGAGSIYLLAKTIDAQPGTIISASQDETAAGTAHQVFLVSETVKYRGNGTDGLKVLSDGNGGGGFFGTVNLVPYEYILQSTLTSNVNNMPWNFTTTSAELAKDAVLNIDGTEGNGSLLLRADGNTAAVNVSGYPLNFNGGDVTIRSRGQTLHRINVGFFGTANGARPGLNINNVGNWVLDANGRTPASGGPAAGGIIQVKADQTSLIALDSPTDPSSGNIVIRANGADADGDGGIILVDTKTFVLGDLTHVAINADGAPNGNGNAVSSPLDSAGPFAVSLKTGSSDLLLGGGNKAVRISATGGAISGNGGAVVVKPTTGKIRIRNSLSVDVSAIATTAEGGKLELGGVETRFNGATAPAVADYAIDARGGSNGIGGEVVLSNPLPYDIPRIIRPSTDDGTPAVAALVTPSNRLGVSTTHKLSGGVTITCREMVRPSPDNWPLRYFNCVNPSSEQLLDKAMMDIAATQPNKLRTQLQTWNTELWYFQNVQEAEGYLQETGFATGGTSYNDKGIAYVVLYKDYATSAGTFSHNSESLMEATGHELGHTIQNNKNNEPNSVPAYEDFVIRDFMLLDFQVVASTIGASTPRDPCNDIDNGDGTFTLAPFGNARDESASGAPICVPGTGSTKQLATKFAGLRNTQILRIASPRIFIKGYTVPGNQPADGWEEIYAQTFSYISAARFNLRQNFFSYTADDVFQAGRFQCTQDWADLRRLDPNAAVPPVYTLPAHPCNTPIEGWYRTLFAIP